MPDAEALCIQANRRGVDERRRRSLLISTMFRSSVGTSQQRRELRSKLRVGRFFAVRSKWSTSEGRRARLGHIQKNNSWEDDGWKGQRPRALR